MDFLNMLLQFFCQLILSADIRKKAEALDSFCRPILTKPKPKPATPETSSPASSQGGESQSQGPDNTNSSADQPCNAGETAGNEVPPPAEPMETDKSESAPGLGKIGSTRMDQLRLFQTS